MTEKKTGLELLREPFPDHQVAKKPKPTKAQNDCPATEKINCKVCGGWHHPKVIHLDYVGHAALTDRLLDADPQWNWEPFSIDDGLPRFDKTGGLWIKLTVCGMTRPGYGHAEASTFKSVGDREKEVIGDALRNAAMRFGAALELWHKGDLHEPESDTAKESPGDQATKPLAEKTEGLPIDADHFCKKHKTEFFKKGAMKSFAHPVKNPDGSDALVNGKAVWCYEHPPDKPASPPAPTSGLTAPDMKTLGNLAAWAWQHGVNQDMLLNVLGVKALSDIKDVAAAKEHLSEWIKTRDSQKKEA